MNDESDVLARICADKRAWIESRQRLVPWADLQAATTVIPPPRGFADAIETAIAAGGYGLIAEIKRASPSKGLIRADFDPIDLAQAYFAGGATCLSVLTDGPYFQGADRDLIEARASVPLPVLRKDFILDPYQIVESRSLGADCILLILAALDDVTFHRLADTAHEWGMDVLAEVHEERELERALTRDDCLIGINSRNLKTLKVDIAVSETLAPLVPAGRRVVGESGLHTRADLDRLAVAGVRAFLIGESLMRQPDVAAATRALLSP